MTDQIHTGNANAEESDELWETLARYLAGESGAGEAARVRRWLNGDRRRAELLAELDAAMERGTQTTPGDIDVEAALARVHEQMRTRELTTAVPRAGTRTPVTIRPARPSRWFAATALRAAAALALVVGAGVAWWLTRSEPSMPATAASMAWETTVGQVDSLRLPDGSGVVLGPDSWLSASSDFGDSDRVVSLEGEAWFDVASDAARPFAVRTPADATVVALGTAFVVRTGANGSVRIAVTSGVVRVGRGLAADEGVTLRAGDRAELFADGDPAVEPGAGSDADVAWLQGRLVFDDAPVDRVAEDLYRWYGIRLTWSHPALGARRVSASFEGEGAAEVLEVLAAGLGARVEFDGTNAVLHVDEGPANQ